MLEDRAVQATWNVLEPSAGPALADAHVQGWGVIVKEALANPWVDVVLSGAVTEPQLAAMAAPPERYWRERDSLPWA